MIEGDCKRRHSRCHQSENDTEQNVNPEQCRYLMFAHFYPLYRRGRKAEVSEKIQHTCKRSNHSNKPEVFWGEQSCKHHQRANPERVIGTLSKYFGHTAA